MGTSGKSFAIKGFRRNSSGNEADFRSRLTSEHLLLSAIKHDNIVQALDLIEDERGRLFTVLEHCDGGDLYSLVFLRGSLEVAEADCFFKQMMRGVDYLHKTGIAHRDLKPENMVLTRQGVVKIADFGESERFRVADVDVAMVGGVQGASPYVAPEVYTSDHYSAKAADVWSMGVIYLTMRLGRYLWITAELEDKYYVQYTQARRTEGGYAWIEGLGKVGRFSAVYISADIAQSQSVILLYTPSLIRKLIVVLPYRNSCVPNGEEVSSCVKLQKRVHKQGLEQGIMHGIKYSIDHKNALLF